MSLKIGDKAPSFDSINQNGDKISLSDFIGRKVILYFYPRDNTPGCTAQACNLRDNIELLKDDGFTVLGVSSDSVKSHEKFVIKYDLPFDLIADEDASIYADKIKQVIISTGRKLPHWKSVNRSKEFSWPNVTKTIDNYYALMVDGKQI